MFKTEEPKAKKLKQLTLSSLFGSKNESLNVEAKKKSTFLSKFNQNRFAKRKFNNKVIESKKNLTEPIIIEDTPPLPTTKLTENKQTNNSFLNALTKCEKELKSEIDEIKMDCKNIEPENAEVIMENDSLDLFENTTSTDVAGTSNNLEQRTELEKQSCSYTDTESPLLFESSEEIKNSPDMIENESSQDTNSLNEFQSTNFTPEQSCLGMLFEDLKKTPDCSLDLPLLEASKDHVVLFKVAPYNEDSPPAPKKSYYEDAWDQHHVKLPCSPKNLYPGGQGTLVNRWETIQSTLLMGIHTSLDLEEVILTYNQRYCNKWSFRALNRFFTEVSDDAYREKFFTKTLPKMVELALSLPVLCPEPIPLLKHHKNLKISLTQQQIACLLCNAFFCTFPRRNARHNKSEYATYPDIHFNRIFEGVHTSYKEKSHMEKIKTILHYFDRVSEKMPTGVVTFERRVMNNPPLWNKSPIRVCGLHLNNEGLIDTHGQGMLQVDFANKYIGGGVVGTGLVQEEIRFIICPELIVSKLFTEVLADNECIVITGAEQYSKYTGYAESYKWAGNFDDSTPHDSWGRRQTEILAIDALQFRRPLEQYKIGSIRRELNKAYCGFYCNLDPDHSSAIATGKWGCGVFNGDPVFKCVIQLMAAAAVGRDLCYFTFNDFQLMKTLHDMHSFIKKENLSISDLWNSMIKYNNEVIQNEKNQNFYKFLVELHNNYNDLTDEET